MINKSDYVESQLIAYFYHQLALSKIDNEIESVEHMMNGVKSPRFDGIPTHGGEDREHLLIRLGERLDTLENKRRTELAECIIIANKLGLNDLEEVEVKLLKCIYYHKYTYEKTAHIIGYTDKSYVYRKKENILNKITMATEN